LFVSDTAGVALPIAERERRETFSLYVLLGFAGSILAALLLFSSHSGFPSSSSLSERRN
jgi:hypothetical protein